MPVLKNSHHERFAVLVAGGMKQTPAYILAYEYQGENAAPMASKLLTDIKVSTRVEEIKAAAAEKAQWSIEQRLEYLRSVALTPVGEVTADHPLCHTVKHTETGTEYKMPDKLRALELFSKLSGDFVDKSTVTHEAGDTLTQFLDKVRKS